MELKFVNSTGPQILKLDTVTGPEEPPLDDASARKKKWAPRARTGCITCRTRRIKCDETRPTCRRCTASQVACRGYLLPPPLADDARDATNKVDIIVSKLQQRKKSTVYKEVVPPNWDFIEAMRYYFEIVKPTRVADSWSPRDPPFHRADFNRTSFIGQIICDQISKASKARGRLLKPGEDPAFEQSWARYWRNMTEAIGVVNNKIRDEKLHPNEAPAFLAIRHLLVLDLYLRRVLWRAHLRGVLAYVQHRGGVKEVLKLRDGPLYLNFAVENIIHANTTSPAKQQFEGLEQFTDEDLKKSLSNRCFAPCPLDIYVVIVHITKLRVFIANEQISPKPSLDSKVKEMFDITWNFDRDGWVKEKSGEQSIEVGQLLGRVFPIAIRLYGIMTLPQAATASWATSSAEIKMAYPKLPEHSAFETLKIQHREEILTLIRRDWGALKYKTALVWPLLVAGVAAGDGAVEDQKFVEHCLEAILNMPITSCAFVIVLEKLRAFWLSGRTEWEDCWDEPIVGTA